MRSHLVLLIMAALVPLIIFSAVMMFIRVQQARSDQDRLLENMAEEEAERIDSQLRRTIAGLQTLGQSDALSSHDLRAFHNLAVRLVKTEHWDHLALLGPGGEHLVNTRLPFGVALPPLNRPDLPIEVAASRQPLVSDLMKGALSGGFQTMIYIPVVEGQTVKYVIAIGIEPARWQHLIEDQMGKGGGIQAVLLDRHSNIIASSYHDGPEPAAGGIKSVSLDMRAGERASSADQVNTINGQRAYVAAHNADFSGWKVVTFVPVEAFDSPIRQTTTVMAAGFLLLLLLGTWLALQLGRRTADSMSQLVASVRAVAAGGAPLPIKSHVAEVTQASQAVNETAALLAARRAELEAADQAKNSFLALLGHELRNPLAPIRNAVQLLKLAGLGSEAARRATSVVDRQSAHLSRLVDDLLDVTRIDHGKIELRKEVIDVGQLLQGVVQDHRGVLEQAGVLLTLDVPTTPVRANCDRIRLAQIIGNLLHNATKFTPRGGRIVIRLAPQGPLAIVEVSDNGSGISPDNLERVFELFAQEQPSGVDGNTGLGIGLALARKLVELHGGRVSATSPGPGQGSTFRVELTAVLVAPADDAVAGSTTPAINNAGARVLVVDDNKDCADSLCEMLAMEGFASTVAYGGQAALLAVEHELPDAVILDIGLPDIDGYEVCRRLRRSNIARQPVLIALTGWGQDKDRDLAIAAGFDAHLTKPADIDQLIALLRESLTRNERSLRAPNISSASLGESSPCVHEPCQLALL
jgi:signal transduction histidine kinase/ActR/RegA family two-component response regulator